MIKNNTVESKINSAVNEFFSFNPFPNYWTYVMATYSAFAWNQEQAEKVLLKLVEQSELTRDEATKILQDMGKQVQENQAQMQKIITDSLQNAFSQWGGMIKESLDEFKKRLDDISGKIASE